MSLRAGDLLRVRTEHPGGMAMRKPQLFSVLITIVILAAGVPCSAQ